MIVGDLEYGSLEYGVVLESKRVTAESFKVTIPRLFTKMSGDRAEIKSVNPDKSRFVNKFKVSGYKIQNFMIAENITDISIKLEGDVTKMSKIIDGISEKETVNKMPVKLIHTKGPPHPPHEHIIKKPMQFKDMIYEDLFRDKINKGDKVILAFINGKIYDPKVMYIPGSVKRGE